MLRDIVGRWAADGADVDVASTQPSYKRGSTVVRAPRRCRVDGVVIRRLRLPLEHGRRWLVPVNAVVFSAWVALRILLAHRPYDVVMTSTAPPVMLAAVSARAARARVSRFVYHCVDIHPDIGRVSGEFKPPLVSRTLQRLDRATCESAAAVVVLSEDMAHLSQFASAPTALSGVADELFDRGLVLPSGSAHDDAVIDEVVGCINDFIKEHA